jgi:hypothetical protein
MKIIKHILNRCSSFLSHLCKINYFQRSDSSDRYKEVLSKKRLNARMSTLVNGEVYSESGVTFFVEIEINGQLTCHNCTSQESVVKLRDTVFNSLEAFTTKISLDNCQIDTLYVTYPFLEDSLSVAPRQEVYLTGNTRVNKVIFDRLEGGTVYRSQGSRINSIINGTDC